MKYSLPISRPPAPARLSVRGGGEPGAPPAQRGVALVITLVLLSIITFMAVTFLVVSRSQHGAVAMETDQVVARLAADSARERAIAELVAPILAGNNEFNYGLLVSTNYISSAGFVSGNVYPTNVNTPTRTELRSSQVRRPTISSRTSPTCSTIPARQYSLPTGPSPTPTSSASTST